MAQGSPLVHDRLPDGSFPIVAARRQVVQGAQARPHGPVAHGHAALVFVTGGEARVEQQGEWALRPGDVLLVPPGAPHRLLENRQREAWTLGLSVASLWAEGGGAALFEPFERVRDGASAVVRIPTGRHARLTGYFEELERAGLASGQDALSELVQRSLVTLILAEVSQASRADTALRGAGGGLVVEALRYIERHALGPLTLEDIAAAVGRSPSHVTSALTRATGRSAIRWVVSARMAEARRRLLYTDERIDVVAERVGYADATHFIRMFRREHHLTPAAWRAASAEARREVTARSVRPAPR